MPPRKPQAAAVIVDTTLADRAIAKYSKTAAIAVPKIKTDATFIDVTTQLKAIKTKQHELEEDRDKIIRPIRSGLDALYAKFRVMSEALSSIERACKDSLEAYSEKKTAKAVTAAKRKALKAPNAEMGQDIIAAAATAEHTPSVRGVTFKTVVDFEIVDAAKVPLNLNGAELRPVDQKAIRRLVKASKGTIEIPGVRVFTKKQSAVSV